MALAWILEGAVNAGLEVPQTLLNRLNENADAKANDVLTAQSKFRGNDVLAEAKADKLSHQLGGPYYRHGFVHYTNDNWQNANPTEHVSIEIRRNATKGSAEPYQPKAATKGVLTPDHRKLADDGFV